MRALEDGDRIFRESTWSREHVRGAGYDLRLAGNLLVVPTRPGLSSYRAVDEESPEIYEIRLAPGDSALISTMERFSFDFDVAGIIGPRFGLASKGLLMLQGSTVHPGYGREQLVPGGDWVPKEDERLYFVVVNVGPDEIIMQPGESIAHMQLFSVEPAEIKSAVPNVGWDRLKARLLRPGSDNADGGLTYFRIVKDLQQEVRDAYADLTRGWEDLRREVADDVKDLGRQVTEAQTAVDRANNASNMVVVFGVFLVSTTVLGFALTALVDLIERFPAHLGAGRTALIAVLAVLYGASAVAGAVLVWDSVRKATGGHQHRK
jgi:deoxycytidine triphosphate deaminase